VKLAFKRQTVGDECTAVVEVAVVGDFKAEVLDVDVPKKLDPGREYKVSMKVKNAGRSVWPKADFTVVLKDIERPEDVPEKCADLRVTATLDEDLAPDAERVVTGQVTGPVYSGDWELSARVLRKKYGLGKELKVKVGVEKDMDADIVSVKGEDELKLGRSFEYRVKIRNSGKTAWCKGLCEVRCEVIDAEYGNEDAAEKAFGKPVGVKDNDWILPGETFEFVHKGTAPAKPGTWKLEWQMTDMSARKPFGDKQTMTVSAD
jgi:hypothetical protein